MEQIRAADIDPRSVAFTISSASGTSERLIVSGALDLSVADRLDAAMRSALEKQPDSLVIDLSEARFVDSTGIDALLTAARLAMPGATELVIVPAPRDVQRVLDESGPGTALAFMPQPPNGSTGGTHPPTSPGRFVSDACEADQGASEADQTASDSDQTAADRDQAGSESDQESSQADQRASDRDEAATDRSLATGDHSAADEASLEASNDERHASTDDRQAVAAAREQTAEDRLTTGTERDEVASHRDLAATARDRAADARDRSAYARPRAADDEAATQAGIDRARAAGDRARAAADRTRAAADREAARAMLAKAHLDGLTGTYRREMGTTLLRAEIDRAHRSGGGMVLVFVDVDGLKEVNDGGGHAAGDALLIDVAKAMRDNLRSYDPIVRFGGDEFVCALADSDLDDAARRFEDIRVALDAARGDASVSVGLARLEAGETLEALLRRSDVALYEAKRRHRRRPR